MQNPTSRPSGSPVGELRIQRTNLPGHFTAEQTKKIFIVLRQSIFKPLGIDFEEEGTIEGIIVRIISLVKNLYSVNPQNNRQRRRSKKAIKIVAKLKLALPKVFREISQREKTLIELIMAEHIQYLVSEIGREIDSLADNDEKIFKILNRSESDYPGILEIIRHTRGGVVERYEYAQNNRSFRKSVKDKPPTRIAAIAEGDGTEIRPEDLTIFPCSINYMIAQGIGHYKKSQNDKKSAVNGKSPRHLSPEVQAYRKCRFDIRTYRAIDRSLGQIIKKPVRRFALRSYQDKDPDNTVGRFVELTLCALTQRIEDYPESEYILVVFQAIEDSLIAHQFQVIKNCTTFYVV